MDPSEDLSINDADLPQPASEEERIAGAAAANEAFQLAFGSDSLDAGLSRTNDDPNGGSTPSPDAKGQAADADKGEGSRGKPAGDDKGKDNTIVDDPYAGLDPKIREKLADYDTLQHRYSALHGRLAPTQQQLETLRRENEELRRGRDPGEATPPKKNAKVEKVRGELPEVADAIESAVQDALAERESRARPATREVPGNGGDDAGNANSGQQGARGQDPAALLEASHKDWREVMKSADFRLFVSAQGAEHSARINGSNDAGEVGAEITRFKENQRRLAEQSERTRSRRLERSVAPRGRPGGGSSAQQSDHDAFLEGFSG